MSSQGSNNLAGYTFTEAAVRDSSDWIALKKQVRVAADQKTLVAPSGADPTPPLSTRDPWLTYSAGFRLIRQLGQYKGGGTPNAPCVTCSGVPIKLSDIADQSPTNYWKLNKDVTISTTQILTIPVGVSLDTNGHTITNNSVFTNLGTINNKIGGTIINNNGAYIANYVGATINNFAGCIITNNLGGSFINNGGTFNNSGTYTGPPY